MKTLAELFPKASQAFIAANQHALNGIAADMVAADDQNAIAPILARNRRGHMNKTETEFALQLETQLRASQILRYVFEGVTLRWADMRYTPDFIVFHRAYIKLIEVKGPHIWSRDLVRFKGARAHWPEFTFELHQKTKNGWKQIY